MLTLLDTRQRLSVVASIGLVTLLYAAAPASAQTAPSLGSAETFAVLAGSTITNTGSSVITGDLGLHPGTAVTGFPAGQVVAGTKHAANAAALNAKNSLTTAYDSLVSQQCTRDLTGQDLGGKTLTAGVYCFSSSSQLTGTLTLNGLGNPNAVFIFKQGSTLTTASGSKVALINGASPGNVFWQVGSSATIGTTTSFVGNILALASITATTGARVTGRTLALTGAVTLDTNAVSATACAAAPAPPIVANFDVTVPFAVTVPHPCQAGFVLINGEMSVSTATVKSTDFKLQLQIASTGRGEDADATGATLPTGAPYYEYSSDVTADADFPDGTPTYFAHTLTVSADLARIGSTTDYFTMSAVLDMEYKNGIPTTPTLETIDVRCK